MTGNTTKNEKNSENISLIERCLSISDKHLTAVWNLESLFIRNSAYISLATTIVSLLVISRILEKGTVPIIHAYPLYISWTLGILTLLCAAATLFLTASVKQSTAFIHMTVSLNNISAEEGLKYIVQQQNDLKLKQLNKNVYTCALVTALFLIFQIAALLCFVGMSI